MKYLPRLTSNCDPPDLAMVQVVEYLLCKCKALSSNLLPTKKKKKKKKRERLIVIFCVFFSQEVFE
jgi:hypothetical protein